MGSPISGFLACIFLEFLESGPFKYVLPRDSHLFRYIDDGLLIYPETFSLPKIVEKLNKKEPTINFSYELETDSTLPFLDIMIHRSDTELHFSVYRKPTNTNDYINFYSHHHKSIKTGVIIGTYLRAYRICSQQFLPDEESYIFQTFKDLNYPRQFILNARLKAIRIHNKTPRTRNKHECNDFLKSI